MLPEPSPVMFHAKCSLCPWEMILKKDAFTGDVAWPETWQQVGRACYEEIRKHGLLAHGITVPTPEGY